MYCIPIFVPLFKFHSRFTMKTSLSFRDSVRRAKKDNPRILTRTTTRDTREKGEPPKWAHECIL